MDAATTIVGVTGWLTRHRSRRAVSFQQGGNVSSPCKSPNSGIRCCDSQNRSYYPLISGFLGWSWVFCFCDNFFFLFSFKSGFRFENIPSSVKDGLRLLGHTWIKRSCRAHLLSGSRYRHADPGRIKLFALSSFVDVLNSKAWSQGPKVGDERSRRR